MSVDLTIVTPSQIAFQGSAAEVQLPGFNGEMGVLPDHAALLTLARPGVVTIHNGADTKRLFVGKGVAEVGPQQVTLLVDLCEDPASVDKAAAQVDLNDALAALKDIAPGTPERAAAEDRIAFLRVLTSA
jgi:F-type H+-transporting ATPase subunit epsilon